MTEIYKESKHFPILRQAFPSYRKHDILVYEVDKDRKVKYGPSQWDEGNIDYHFLVSPTGEAKNISFQSWPKFEQKEVEVLPGYLFVTAGRSGGKAALMVVYF